MAERAYTDLELERMIAGDLPATRVAEINAKGTDADRARIDELRRDNDAFLSEIDVAAEVRAIGKKLGKLEPERKGAATWWRWVFGGGALAALAAVMLVVVMRKHDVGPPQEDDIRTKGAGITFAVYANADGGARKLASGDTVAPGTKIRFEIGAPKKGYVAVVGSDAFPDAFVAKFFYPYGGTQAAAFDPAGGGLLPGAIELDANPTDRYIAVFSERPFTLAEVSAALSSGPGKPLPDARPKLPADLSSVEVRVNKTAR